MAAESGRQRTHFPDDSNQSEEVVSAFTLLGHESEFQEVTAGSSGEPLVPLPWNPGEITGLEYEISRLNHPRQQSTISVDANIVNDLVKVKYLVESGAESHIGTIVTSKASTNELHSHFGSGGSGLIDSQNLSELHDLYSSDNEDSTQRDELRQNDIEEEGTDIYTLGGLIRSALVPSQARESRLFLPNDALEKIITRKRVQQELAQLNIVGQDLNDLTEEILDVTPPLIPKFPSKTSTRMKIFAILALMEKIEEIVHFIDNGLHDSDLPFIVSSSSHLRVPQLCCKDKDGNLNPIQLFANKEQWKPHHLEIFNVYQWRLLAPYFELITDANRRVLHYTLDDESIILPFIEDEGITQSSRHTEGDYGEVWRIKIHPAHHNYCADSTLPNQNPSFAVKRFGHESYEAFRSGVSSLKRISERGHVDLIKLLVTFQWRKQFYLLFPWADGNLNDFWKRYPQPSFPLRNHDLAVWFSAQCLGLVRGLKTIHTADFALFDGDDLSKTQKRGVHGDLKPENILWFKSYEENTNEQFSAVMKISDFGLMQFYRTDSRSRLKRVSVSRTYEPPEYDVNLIVSQSYDAWALGCVLLHFVTWYLIGWQEIEDFSKARTKDDNREFREDGFFNLVKIKDEYGGSQLSAREKLSVREEFDKLYNHPNCTDFILDLLSLIDHRLLQLDPNKRADCGKMVLEFTELYKSCKKDHSYTTKRLKRPPGWTETALLNQETTLDLIPEIPKAENVNQGTAREAQLSDSHRDMSSPNKSVSAEERKFEYMDQTPEFTDSTIRPEITGKRIGGQAVVENVQIENEQYGFANTDSGYASGQTGHSADTYKWSNVALSLSEPKLGRVAEGEETQGQVNLNSLAINPNPPDTGLYDQKTAYSPSETPSLPALENRIYIDELACELFKTVVSHQPDQETLNRVSQLLPDLLRAFSLKIGYRAAPNQCHVAYFLHKYRGHVQQSFEDNFPLQLVPETDVNDSSDTGAYKIERFFEGLGAAEDPPQEQDYAYQDLSEGASSAEPDRNGGEEDDLEPPELALYRDFVLNSPAFDWLVTTLQTEINLTRQSADVMRSIRDQILGTLPSSHGVSRRKASREYKATFEIDWDPLCFVKDQKYEESTEQAIERSLTLTGSLGDAQALTTGQYLAQTWPTSGVKVMRIISAAIRNHDLRASGTLPDGTELQIHIDSGKVTVNVTGIGDSLAEVAQQFAWLGAALRSSPFESGIAISSPVIRSRYAKNIKLQGKQIDSEMNTEIFCAIEFDIEEPLNDMQRTDGHCWHSMFRNPVMVRGFPIMAKYKTGLGLEMPLNFMSKLVGSKHANDFDGKTFIKGFSAMLVATEVSENLLLWHYYYNLTGDRISYLDHDLKTMGVSELNQLSAARHIVGWCRECSSYAGAANVSYGKIGSVDLPPPHADCILDRVTFSAGKLISGGVSVALGVQHIPPHLTRDSYLGKLTWIATRFVVFWDEIAKRGWLVNGTSALLHLVRASIQHNQSGDFSALMVFDSSKLKIISELKPNSASKTMSDRKNLEVEVQLDKVEKTDEYESIQGSNNASTSGNREPKTKWTYKLFGHVVEEHYRHLEQIMDYQVHAGGQNGVKLKLRARQHLEGWDFTELATGHDPTPRLATLEVLGWGWVDFVRSIEAITLIGSGFGEMIRPVDFDGMCPNWKRLPSQKYYLAATVFDLKKVIGTKKFGGSLKQPTRLVRDLLWHSPQGTVVTCPCQRQQNPQGRVNHHDPVQVFYPTVLKPFGMSEPDISHDAGAIVFGNNISWRRRWKNKGHDLIDQDEQLLQLAAVHNAPIVSPQSIASSEAVPAQVGSSSSQSHETNSGMTAYTSISNLVIAPKTFESDTGLTSPSASTSSEISPGSLTPAEASMTGAILQDKHQRRGKRLFQKIAKRMRKSKIKVR